MSTELDANVMDAKQSNQTDQTEQTSQVGLTENTVQARLAENADQTGQISQTVKVDSTDRIYPTDQVAPIDQALAAIISPENFRFINKVELRDIPWHRLTTPYGRATDFPLYLSNLFKMQGSLEGVKEDWEELKSNIEHQSTLWHASPFAVIFLCRILEKALQRSKHIEDYGGERDEIALFIADKVFSFLLGLLEIYQDQCRLDHVEALPLFSDMLKEEYLWSEVYDEEEDFKRYEEAEGDVFPASLSYSFYFFSCQAILVYTSALAGTTPFCFAPHIIKLLSIYEVLVPRKPDAEETDTDEFATK